MAVFQSERTHFKMTSNSFFEIQDLKEFLKISLGTDIVRFQLKCLTKPGDNYGSIIQSIDVKVTENDEKVNDKVNYFELNCSFRLINIIQWNRITNLKKNN